MREVEQISDAKRLTPAARVRHKDIGGRVVVVDLESGAYWSLNETASAIWRGLLAGEDTRAVVERVLAEFTVDREAAERDVAACLGQWRDDGLVEDTVADRDAETIGTREP